MRKRTHTVFRRLFQRGIVLCLTVCVIGGAALGLTGCRETPEESAVVSKAGGLSEEVILEPMKEGELRETDIPAHWQMNELKSKDRVTISADLELEQKEIGNLPVIEMKNHVLSEKELGELVTYFAKGEELYVPQPYTKEVYQNVLSRIENREGIYGASYVWLSIPETKKAMETALEIAPDSLEKPEKAEVKFGKRFVDEAWEKGMKSRSEFSETDFYKNREKPIWFEADVGESRTAHITAETYDAKAGNSSRFEWVTGAEILSEQEVTAAEMFFTMQEDNPFTPKMTERIGQYLARYEEGAFEISAGEAQAEQVLEELGIKDMGLASWERALWFPEEAYAKEEMEAGAADSYDLFWSLEASQAESGYRYTFSRSIGGLHVLNGESAVAEQTEDMYSPPFPAETITITVTESGVKEFVREGMAEEVKTIAENTKLLSFEKIQETLVEQVFYWYSGMAQPENDTTTFQYKAVGAKLGYTYIPAYEQPEHAWLVPAWSFVMTEGKNNTEFQYISYLIEAIEGRVIK